MSSLHIALFNRAFYPEISATGQLLTELAQGLVRDHRCRVTVVAGMPQAPFQESWIQSPGWWLIHSEEWNGITIWRARGTAWDKGRFWRRLTNYLTYFGSACLAAFKLDRPDVIIALTDPPIIGLAGLLASRRFRCPLVISYRDLFPEVAHLLEKPPGKFVEWVLNAVNRFLNKEADRLIALGEAMRDRLIQKKKANPEKIIIIPDWADICAIRPEPKRNSFSQTHGLAERFVVMHSGNIGTSQNLDVLIDAADALRPFQDILFVLVGDGVRKSSLQEYANLLGLTNVLFLPYQPKEMLSAIFASADCFYVSLKPGLAGYITPSKLYGILAAGRPYIAAVEESCEVFRITRKYNCGLLAQPGNSSDITEKIRKFYDDPELVRELGANARKGSEEFDRAKGVSAYFRLCRELTSAGT